jgi:Peptidase M15
MRSDTGCLQGSMGVPVMQPLYASARPTFGTVSSRCLATVAITAAATVFGGSARAAVDDSWAGPLISQMMSERAEEGGSRGRTRSTHKGAVDPEDAPSARSASTRRKSPARHREGGRLASLGRDIQPHNLRPLSVIEWARPNLSVTIPKEGGSAAEGVGPMLASLGRDFLAPAPLSAPNLTGDAIKWLPTAPTDCLAAPLRGVLVELAGAFGPITVRWTCRSKEVNARVGGAKRSYHLTGNAVDFNMTGNFRAVLAFLKAKKEVGGLKHYGGGAFHIDTGPRRTW